jgi:hypothetical protein
VSSASPIRLRSAVAACACGGHLGAQANGGGGEACRLVFRSLPVSPAALTANQAPQARRIPRRTLNDQADGPLQVGSLHHLAAGPAEMGTGRVRGQGLDRGFMYMTATSMAQIRTPQL